MKKNLLASVLALTFIFPSFTLAQASTKTNSPARKAAESITAAQMRAYLSFIASDEMEGRDTPSRGLDITAKFIAMQLSRWGFKPAGDNGTFLQKIGVKRKQVPTSQTQSQQTRPSHPFSFNSNEKYDPTKMVGDEYVTTQNVVAIWEGSDPVLRNEYVAIGAHYDHEGINPNALGPDKILNGADDDGSGTTGVLAIAEALAKSSKRPKRSILFVWHCGEERGLWGSEYFTKYPTVPLERVITQLNVDMIGRSKKAGDTNPKNKDLSGENEIYVIGLKMMSTQLGNVTESVNKSFLNLNYNFKYDDPKDPNRFFFRSDHFHYAVKGVPIIFWFNGKHEDYHGVDDEPEKIDYQKMEKIARTIFLTMWELADLRSRPFVDKQLPLERTQR